MQELAEREDGDQNFHTLRGQLLFDSQTGFDATFMVDYAKVRAILDRGDGGGFLDNPAVRSMMRSAGTVLGREITRTLFGTARRRR